jgi:hypothetical protein
VSSVYFLVGVVPNGELAGHLVDMIDHDHVTTEHRALNREQPLFFALPWWSLASLACVQHRLSWAVN